MKHILNNLSEQEKNAIREQHTGGMNVVTENFHKLLGSKLGDSKPLVNEQLKTKDGVTYTVQTIPSGKFKIFVTTPKYKTPTDAFTVFGGGSMWKEYSTQEEAQKAIDSVVKNSKFGDSKPLVNEQNQTGNDRISNLATIMKSVQTKQLPQQVIVNPSSSVNNMSWNDYVGTFKITPQEIDQANALLTKMGQTSPIKGSTPSTPTNQPTPYGSSTMDLPSVTVVGKKPKKPGVRPTAGLTSLGSLTL